MPCILGVSFIGRRSKSKFFLLSSEQVCSHASDGCFALVLVQSLVYGSPPFKEHALADKLEPGGKLEGVVLEHGLEVGFGDVFGGLDFVGVDIEVDVGLDEEDVIN